jgi:predicted HicB family RNase H-like nuclease
MPDPKRGRPAVVPDDTTTAVNVRVPTRDYDRACTIARRDGTSLSQLVRRGLKHVVDDDEDGDE